MIRFVFQGWLCFDGGSPDRMPVALRSVPQTAPIANDSPALAAGEARLPLEE
jgi:hypothetical protein